MVSKYILYLLWTAISYIKNKTCKHIFINTNPRPPLLFLIFQICTFLMYLYESYFVINGLILIKLCWYTYISNDKKKLHHLAWKLNSNSKCINYVSRGCSMFLPNEATIFAAEFKTIELAFEYIKLSKNTIFSDSLSCLNNLNINHPFILNSI